MNNPLIGHWRSNKQLTRNEVNNCKKYSSSEIDELFSLVNFGELEFIFTDNEITTKYQDTESTAAYTILSSSESTISILASDLGELQYEIVDNNMYVADGLKHFREVFTKIA